MGKRAFLAAGLVVAFLAFDFLSPALPSSGPRMPWGMLVTSGVVIGQINLIATWGALGPGNVVVRMPWSILLGIFTWYAMMLGFRAWRPENLGSPDLALLGPMILGGVIVAQVPLWIASKRFRWRLINLEDRGNDLDGGPLQFNVRHMLLVMFLVALALGPARIVLPPLALDVFQLEGTLGVILTAIVVTNLVMTVPCIWGALVKANPVSPLAWSVYCAVVTAIEFGALCLMLGSPGSDWLETLFGFFLVNLLQCATVYFVLRRFRAVGFRLVHVSPV